VDDRSFSADTIMVAASPTSVAVMTGIPIVAAAATAAAASWRLAAGLLVERRQTAT
jgi:hypothetical protein